MSKTYIYPPVSVQTSSAPIEFIKDGVSEQVVYDSAVAGNTNPLPSGFFILKDGEFLPVAKDTGNPANTNAVPVELVGAAGPINITAGDLNVQLTDLGVNFDRTRIGDGTNQWNMNASNEGLVHDADVLAELQTINTNTSGLATEATLSAIKTAAELIDDTIATDGGASLAKFQTIGGHTGTVSHAWHVDASGNGRVDVRSSVLPTGAATEATLATLATEATALNIYNELVTIGNESVANDLITHTKLDSIITNTTGKATEAKQDTMITSLASIASEDFATETTLAAMSAKLPVALGQGTMAQSMRVVLPSDQTVATQNVGKVASYVQSLTIDGTTQQTFNAPANAKWVKVIAGIDNTVDLMVNFGANATSTVGFEMQSGRSEDFDAVANISVIAKSAATNQKISLIWGV